MRKKLGFALGAGGSRGVAHIGFLQAMEEHGIRPDFIAGSSMGAVVGGVYAAGVSPKKMHDLVKDIKLRSIASVNSVPIRKNGLMKMKRARKLLVSVMGERKFEELQIPFSCVATDLLQGESVRLAEGNVIDAIIASSSIPGIFTPAKIGEYEMLSDGGILDRVPARAVREMGADVVVAVDVLGSLMEKKSTGKLVNTFLRYIDVMDSRLTLLEREKREYISLWLEPDLGAMDQYKLKQTEFAYKRGYELGNEHAEEIRRLMEH